MKIRHRAFALNFLLFALVSVAYAQTSEPGAQTKPTIVIVHGAWGGSWAFRKVDSMLRQKGFNVYRPQLTVLGERVHLNRPDIRGSCGSAGQRGFAQKVMNRLAST